MSQQSLVERVLTPVGISGDNIIYLCPKCGEQSGHFYVNYKTGKYNCFRCKELKGRSINSLLRYLKIDSDFDYEDLEDSYDKRLEDILELEDVKIGKRLVDYSRNIGTLNKYYNYHVTELSLYAKNYLNNRGISDYYIERFKIKEGLNRYNEEIVINGTTYKGRDYSGRVMIPSLFKSGLVSFYLGRDYTGTKPNKYSNVSQELAYASEDVWSLNLIDSDDVIICEGTMTAMAVDIACGSLLAVATYGKSIATKSNADNDILSVTSQGEKLLRRKFKTYYVFYDADVSVESKIDTCRYLHDRGANVMVVDIPEYLINKYGPHTDAADMTRDEVISCLRNAKVYDKFLELGL